MFGRSNRFLVFCTVLIAPSLLVSCASNSESLCTNKGSVAAVVVSLQQGLENFSESELLILRIELSSAIDTSVQVAKSNSEVIDAVKFSISAKKLMTKLDEISWSLSEVLISEAVISASRNLSTSESLRQANVVESFIIGQCGMTSVVENVVVPDTLPMPGIAAPTATDPPTNTINQQSENEATGMVLASIFGLSLSIGEAACLGSAMDGVVDVTAVGGSVDQYSAQFQKAFNGCNIDFVIP